MKYSWTKALPYLLGLAMALLLAALNYLSTLHPSSVNAITLVTLAGVLGDWIRAKLSVLQKEYPVPQITAEAEPIAVTLGRYDPPPTVTINLNGGICKVETKPADILHQGDGEHLQ